MGIFTVAYSRGGFLEMQITLESKFISTLLFLIIIVSFLSFMPSVFAAATENGNLCTKQNTSFFGIPTWYEFLTPVMKSYSVSNGNTVQRCTVELSHGGSLSGVETNPNEFWLVGLAIIDILLRLGGLVAGGMIIYAGFRYITSQGNPDNAKAAKNSIINAVVGLVIVLVATGVVQFIGNKIG
jgi:hypothetical protein